MEEGESVVLVGREDPRISQAVEQFQRDYPDSKKALMAVNTHTLFLLLKELGRRGVAIPGGMGVCGYDALGWSELVYPGVSAIQQPMGRMGTLAAEELLACIEEKRMSWTRRALDGAIFFRASTALRHQ